MRWTFSREATVWGWAPRPALPARAGVFNDPRENLKVHRILRCTLSSCILPSSARPAPQAERAARVRTLLCVTSLLTLAGCLFAPDVALHGYASCDSNADCEPGRGCDSTAKICAPPPWHDTAFGDRRVLVVKNESARPMVVGTAVPLVIGGDGDRRGLLGFDDVPVDFRFADFSLGTASWSVRSVFLDREDDRITAWIPLAREIVQGRSDVLAWLESDTFDGGATVVTDAATTFTIFESFEDDLDGQWLLRGTGGAPNVRDGLVNVGDNQSLVLSRPLTPPLSATALARVNGVNCTEVFIGFSGDEDAAFALPPALGLFIDAGASGLLGTARLGSLPVEQGGQLADRGALTIGGALMRVQVTLDGAGARVRVDDVTVLDEVALRPPFADEPVYFAIHVGGACSLDVEALWITPLPLPSPKVTVGPLVELSL